MGWVNTEKLEWLRDDLRDVVDRGEWDPRSYWNRDTAHAYLRSAAPGKRSGAAWPFHLIGIAGSGFAGALVFGIGLSFLDDWGLVKEAHYGLGFVLGAALTGALMWGVLNYIWRKRAEEAGVIYREAKRLAEQADDLTLPMSDPLREKGP